MLIDHGDGEHEAGAVSLFDESSFEAFHRSGANADAFADDHVEPWLEFSSAGLGLKKFDFAIGNGEGLMCVADDAQGAGGTEDDSALVREDTNEEVRGKEGALCFNALAVLPDFLDLIGREKGFDLTDLEQAADGVLALRHGVESEPSKGLIRS